jgi:hypothetical protein
MPLTPFTPHDRLQQRLYRRSMIGCTATSISIGSRSAGSR